MRPAFGGLVIAGCAEAKRSNSLAGGVLRDMTERHASLQGHIGIQIITDADDALVLPRVARSGSA